MLASVPITEELRMLRIATEERTLQYALFLEKTALSIKVDRGFARSVAPEVISIAFRNRGPVTNANDVRALGEFIPYRDGVSWGYGSCLRIETLDDAAECWIIDMPAWSEDDDLEAYFAAHAQTVYTLDAVFTALNVPNEKAKSFCKQRLEVDLSYDYRQGAFTIKAELSAQAVDHLMFLGRGEHRDIEHSMREVFSKVVPIGANIGEEDFYSLYENKQQLALGIRGAEMRGQMTESGGCLLAPKNVTCSDQVFGFLAGLATLDDILSDFLPPHL